MSDQLEDFLAHYGVKGMKWGRRKARNSDDGDRPKRTPSEDHLTAKALKKKRVSEMSNADLKKLTTRMQLEKQYAELTQDSRTVSRGEKFVKRSISVGNTINQVAAFANSPAGKLLASQIKQRMAG